MEEKSIAAEEDGEEQSTVTTQSNNTITCGACLGQFDPNEIEDITHECFQK